MRISIFSHKGGVGKSTISVSMALELSALGNDVLLIDRDLVGYASSLCGIKGGGLLSYVIDEGSRDFFREFKNRGTFSVLKFYGDGPRFKDDIRLIQRDERLMKTLRKEYRDVLTSRKYDYVILDNMGMATFNDEPVKLEHDLFQEVYPEMRKGRIYVTDSLGFNFRDAMAYMKYNESLNPGDGRPIAFVINMIPPGGGLRVEAMVREVQGFDPSISVILVPFIEELFQYSGAIVGFPEVPQIHRFVRSLVYSTQEINGLKGEIIP
ncbi:CobQ/CobB/MinD/ParA nucleotide binding domain-containing protein [Metallosphaera yellowstonensis MK1]|jgi:MinD-like ATPase involved in chromosome partitioning or flagellar assembly|uniref:CobQ/CobB/MinD/ParA nucleotide binding domain-containing protein n=1 Tax=Metallosphaera yellowstonensis MK1 TaxID=671065 RepID=H2C417_9CREN|nr:ParA family protein [Metallosphaera yellowstonensis]EHP70912.1 CobQ/CobB/MinD/ParA nucleotide binding domain-containing protein [Metallosphaera yellowstonensis MK1]